MHAITPSTHDTATRPTPRAEPAAERSAAAVPRLTLARAGSARALLDGAWWPRSRDLTAEVPGLVAALDPLWDRITRITVNPAFWPVVPHKIPVPGHVVKVGWFTNEQDPHKLMLLSYQVGRWDLLVIPPETDPDTAGWLMAATAEPLRPLTASQLMAEAGDRTTAVRPDTAADRAMQAAWTSEGGRDCALRAVAGTHN